MLMKFSSSKIFVFLTRFWKFLSHTNENMQISNQSGISQRGLPIAQSGGRKDVGVRDIIHAVWVAVTLGVL